MKITDPKFQQRSIFQHFNKTAEIEKNVLDLREYRVSHMALRDQESRRKDLLITKKTVYERALPLLV